MIISFIVLSFNYCKPEEFMVPTTYQGCKSGQGLSLAISLGYCEHELYLTFAEKKRKVEPKRTKLLQEAVQFFPLTNCIYTCQLKHLGHFSFVRTDWPGYSHHNENLTFNQNYPARAIKSYVQVVVCRGDGFSSKTLGKSLFHCHYDWSGLHLPSQFWLWKAPFFLKQPTDITSPKLRLFLKPRV